jgi:hypothetical protein
MSYLKVCLSGVSAIKTIKSSIHRTVAASICFGVLLLSGCAPLPVNYAPSSIKSASGALRVGEFNYLPASGASARPVAANQIRNTALGQIKIDRDVNVFVRDAVFAELRMMGVNINDSSKFLTGDIEEFLIDDLGYSVDWTIRIKYTLTDASSKKILYQAVKSGKHNTAKFANVFGALNEQLKLNIEQLADDSDFIKAINTGPVVAQNQQAAGPAPQLLPVLAPAPVRVEQSGQGYVASAVPGSSEIWHGLMACDARKDSGPNFAAYQARFEMEIDGNAVTIHRQTANVIEKIDGKVAGNMVNLLGTGYQIGQPNRKWQFSFNAEFSSGAMFSGKGNMIARGNPIRACELIMTRAGQQPRGMQIAQLSPAPGNNAKEGNKFSQLHLGMTIKQVNEVVGFPNDTDSHESGKRWIPFYFGNDARRLEALYQNEGCLVFASGNIFGANAEGELKEIKVDPTGSCFRN